MDREVKWFETQEIEPGLYLTTEVAYTEGNRANLWLLKGPSKDILIDAGLGVCNLRQHLEELKLIEPPGGSRECLVICTHVHFDHSGGAHHFEKVFIHKGDLSGLRYGKQLETINYVKSSHFLCQPYPEFSAFSYTVPPTKCQPLEDGQKIDIGEGHHLEIIHVPGHTKGNIIIYYPLKGYLFSGDFVYECGVGTNLIDWLPCSAVGEYIESARRTLDWLQQPMTNVQKVLPGHFNILNKQRLEQLLLGYIEGKSNCGSRCMTGCVQAVVCCFIGCHCFRCCPC